MQKRIKWSQTYLGLVLVFALLGFGYYLSGLKAILPLQLLAGVSFGYALTRSRYGFAGGVKRLYMRGEASLSKALLLLFAFTSVVFAGIQWKAASEGALPAFVEGAGDFIIPGTQNVEFVNLATLVGGFLFGIGMIMVGCCASGTLSDLGEGRARALISLIFFVLSAAPGQAARAEFDRTALGQIGFQLHLPQVFGYFGALVLTLALLAGLWWWVVDYEKKRKENNTSLDPYGDWEEIEKPLEPSKASSLFSYETYHKLFVERWTFFTGTVIIALTAIFVLVTTESPWGVTSPFVTWDVAFLQNLDVEFSEANFGSYLEKIERGLLLDGPTIRNIGLFAGSFLAFLLANRFRIRSGFSFRDGIYYAIGGTLLGFGSRLALGCNIGALYSAIASFSISGWFFLIAAVAGGVIGLKFFQGKINIIPVPIHCERER